MDEDLLEIAVSELVKQQNFIHDHEESESFISQFEADVSVLSSLSIRLNDFESKLGASLSTPDWSKNVDMQYVSIRRNRYFLQVHEILNKIYGQLSELIMPRTYPIGQGENDESLHDFDARQQVFCIETEQFVVVKTPHLHDRQTYINRHWKEGIHRNRFYSYEANRAVLEAVKQPNRFKSKNICVLSIYDIEPRRGAPDNDNIDSKKIIDAIVQGLGSSDGAFQCSFFLSSFISNDIEDGTYFVVSEGAGRCPEIEKIQSVLQDFFPAK